MNSSSLFKQINIVPRWIVFTLDLLITLVSFCIAYAIKINFNMAGFHYVEFSRNTLIILSISTIVFFTVKTYAGIIRYTSAQDSFRILWAVLITNGSFFLMNIVSVAFAKPLFISNSILIINSLACFLLMLIYRVVIKFFFVYIKMFSVLYFLCMDG